MSGEKKRVIDFRIWERAVGPEANGMADKAAEHGVNESPTHTFLGAGLMLASDVGPVSRDLVCRSSAFAPVFVYRPSRSLPVSPRAARASIWLAGKRGQRFCERPLEQRHF